MWGIFIGLISGVLMSVQGVFNAEVTKQSSIWLSATFVQITAFVVCVLAWFVTGKEGNVLSLFQVQPKYMLLGGAIGAFITYTVIQAMNQCGPARAVMFIVTAQLVVAYIIELMGVFGVDKQPFEWRKILGLIVMIVGIITFKWK
ncbi:MAG: DMT family transporter [Eubacterium sp.]